jgi:hypothetical protein
MLSVEISKWRSSSRSTAATVSNAMIDTTGTG